jgi:putative hydrolase of the HAD superfamily
MNQIKAIGFDLFNTLITVEPHTLGEAMNRLFCSLEKSGFAIDYEPFKQRYRQAAVKFIEEARQDGRETHNRFWICTALNTLGYNISPDDPRIAAAVDGYFSAFFPHCRLVPGTKEMLESLSGQYLIGLLSNFTHPPAAREIMKMVGLTPFFDKVLISGDLGYRKPHPSVFQQLIDTLKVEKKRILYIGDDPESDILGARQAGLQPVWTTYVRDHDIPSIPGVLYKQAEEPDEDVPRISVWNDLFIFLENL